MYYDAAVHGTALHDTYRYSLIFSNRPLFIAVSLPSLLLTTFTQFIQTHSALDAISAHLTHAYCLVCLWGFAQATTAQYCYSILT
jgi:hypothetical protein